jgi:hypothetical protein
VQGAHNLMGTCDLRVGVSWTLICKWGVLDAFDICLLRPGVRVILGSFWHRMLVFVEHIINVTGYGKFSSSASRPLLYTLAPVIGLITELTIFM